MALPVVLWCAFLISTLFIIFLKLFDKVSSPIFGIYQRPCGVYKLKVIFAYVILACKQVKTKLSPIDASFYHEKDKPQKLPSTPKAVDAVYFNGTNKSGDCLFMGLARRPHRLVDGFLYLKLTSSHYGLLESLRLPDTSLFNNSDIEESYEAEGLKAERLEPMKKWRLTYKGKVREALNKTKIHDVQFEAIYNSDEPCFNYEWEMDPWMMAKCVSFEKWDRDYFKAVKKYQLFHYEQFGIVKAKVVIDSKEEFCVELDTVRDRSMGDCRDWGQIHRYVLHWLTSENGDHFSIGNICLPIAYSRMQFGYMYKAQERKMYPITNTDLTLHNHGELGNPATDYGFTFSAGGTDYAVRVKVTEAPYFYISKGWEQKIYECVCNAEINGVKGYGGAEWSYRNPEGHNVKE